MAGKPAAVLVHGFWGGAAHWSKVVVELHRRGFTDLHAVENPLTSLADDAERTRKMVKHPQVGQAGRWPRTAGRPLLRWRGDHRGR